MSTILEQNEQQIRQPFEVHCGLNSISDIEFTTFTTDGFLIDDDMADIVDDTLAITPITDLSGEGYALDGTCDLYNASTAVKSGYKVGLYTETGGTATVTIAADSQIDALTIKFAENSGSGTLTATDYDESIRSVNVVPVNAKSITLTFTADEDERVIVQSILPGIAIEFDNSNLISCVLNLRSNLDLEPSFEISDIEIQGYYADDLSEVISNLADDVPIWYYSGYEGDYSSTRYFYLSEKATSENNVITLKGEDAAAKLDDKTYYSRIWVSKNKNVPLNIYKRMKTILSDCGISATKEANPSTYGSTTTTYYVYFKEMTARDTMAEIMNLARQSTLGFYPRFVDAGIPKLEWSEPTSSWTIYEKDVGEFTEEFDRNINKIKDNSDDVGFVLHGKKGSKKTIDSKSVSKGKKYTVTWDGYYYNVSVTNTSSVSATAEQVIFKAKKKGTCKIKGYPITFTEKYTSYSKDRAGVTLKYSPPIYGRGLCTYNDTTYQVFPNYKNLFNRSNEVGTFTWKGNPKMQPRDVFTFVRLDGTEEICTISEIVLSHEGGGTTAQISYRKGIV